MPPTTSAPAWWLEGSEVITQEPVAAPPGTSMAVRNLFYNVPARRNFLKSDSVELRHIREEYIPHRAGSPLGAFRALRR